MRKEKVAFHVQFLIINTPPPQTPPSMKMDEKGLTLINIYPGVYLTDFSFI